MTITVVIAAKDCEMWLEDTISSLLRQTHKDWDCIISINGSSDRTEDIARNLKDPRIRVINSSIPNKSLALNRAIITSNSDWISILDADDLWHEDKLKTQASFVTENSVDIVGTQMLYIDAHKAHIPNAPKLPNTHEECIVWLDNGNNPIANSSVLYRRSIHDLVGYYDPERFAVEDYDMWMRSKRANLKFSNIEHSLMLHRLHIKSHFNSTIKQANHKSVVDQLNSFYMLEK